MRLSWMVIGLTSALLAGPLHAADTAIARANAVEYGLAAYAFTNDLQRAATFAEGIDAILTPATPSSAFGLGGGLFCNCYQRDLPSMQ